MFSRILASVFCVGLFCFVCGCSEKGNAVIQPGADYQPTAEEKAAQDAMNAAREGQQ